MIKKAPVPGAFFIPGSHSSPWESLALALLRHLPRLIPFDECGPTGDRRNEIRYQLKWYL